MEDYLLLNLNKNEVTLYKSCFDKNGSPKRVDNIEWQFLNNPKKCAFVKIAFDEERDTVAAIYAASCIDFTIEGNIEIGTQSLDTITDLDYRGKGLFTNLAKSVYKEATENNVAFVYGFPNGNSVHGFKKKLGWVILDPVPFLIKPLNTKYFTKKLRFLKFLPNLKLSFQKSINNSDYLFIEENNFPDKVNDLWKKYSKNIKVAINRDQNYLIWRFIEKPNENYKIVHCYSVENDYLGFVVFTIKDKHEGKIAYIMELIYNLDQPDIGKLLLQYAINSIIEEKADCILAWSFEHSPSFSIFKRNRFFNLIEKLRPIELHFGVHSFQKELNEVLFSRKNWYLSYSDSDTV